MGYRGFAGALLDDLQGTGIGVSACSPADSGRRHVEGRGIELPRWVPSAIRIRSVRPW